MSIIDTTAWPVVKTLALPKYRKPLQIRWMLRIPGRPDEIADIENEHLSWTVEILPEAFKGLRSADYYVVETADGHTFPGILTAWESGDGKLPKVTFQDLSGPAAKVVRYR